MDTITKLTNNLQKIKESFDLFKKSGLNEEVLVVWLMHQTKLSRKKVMTMLLEQERFFDNLIADDVAEKL